MRRLQALASRLGARLFRQNTGMAWVGNKVIRGPCVARLNAGDIAILKARAFHAGVKGMSDLGGWVPVEITSDMVGMTLAVYAQVEVKENGRPSAEQIAWIEAVNKAGGRAGIARCEEELRSLLAVR